MHFFNLDYKRATTKTPLIKITVANSADSFDKRKTGEKTDFLKRRVYAVLKSANFRFYSSAFV